MHIYRKNRALLKVDCFRRKMSVFVVGQLQNTFRNEIVVLDTPQDIIL